MMRVVGLSGTMVLWSMQWPQSLSKLTTWMSACCATWSMVLWVWMALVDCSPDLGLCYYKVSGGRGVWLQWRSNGPDHSRSNWLWLLTASHFGNTDYQQNHRHDYGQCDKWVVCFTEQVENILLAACHQAELSIKKETTTRDLTDLNKAAKMTKKEEIYAFLQRSYMPKLRPCFWAATCMWWCRP